MQGGLETPVGTAVTSANGIATLTGAGLAGFSTGIYPGVVIATFAGDSTSASSSASGTLTVTATDHVALSSSTSPSISGESITFGAMVIPLGEAKTPTGTIQFQVDGVNLGETVSLVDGDAYSGPISSLTVGTHTVTAVYSGDSTYPGATSSLTQTVESPSQATGNVYTVTSLVDVGTGTGPYGDLRYAITQADNNPGSMIDFNITGNFIRTCELPCPISGADVTIAGPGPSLLTVQGGGTASNFSVFAVTEQQTATISGLTITGGHSAAKGNGGGVYDGGTLTMSDCIVTGNTATFSGGGIFVYGSGSDNGANPSKLTLTDCTISKNSVVRPNSNGSYGGGIEGWFASNLNLTDCTIAGNSAGQDGGIGGTFATSLTMDRVVVAGNSVTATGGGIGFFGTLNVSNSTISENSSVGQGAGIFTENYETMTLINSTISGNTARDGAGLYNKSYDASTITNCTFYGNSALSGGGGGIENGNSALTLTGCRSRTTPPPMAAAFQTAVR